MWNLLEGVVMDARIRAQKSHFLYESPVFVDFGVFGLYDGPPTNAEEKAAQEKAAKEKAVRNALGFNLDEETWSGFFGRSGQLALLNVIFSRECTGV